MYQDVLRTCASLRVSLIAASVKAMSLSEAMPKVEPCVAATALCSSRNCSQSSIARHAGQEIEWVDHGRRDSV